MGWFEPSPFTLTSKEGFIGTVGSLLGFLEPVLTLTLECFASVCDAYGDWDSVMVRFVLSHIRSIPMKRLISPRSEIFLNSVAK
jgi:hypothetical protein